MVHVIPSHQGRPSDDPIFALNREATLRKQRGDVVVNATVGALLDDEGRLAVLPTAARTVHDVTETDWATYAPIAGNPEFLSAVIDDLLAGEPELHAAATAVATPGGTGALRHAISNFMEPGQAVLTSSFFWGPYQTLADEADRKLATFAMFAADGGLNVEALDQSLRSQVQDQKRVLFFLNDPCHNPTGYSMTPEEWRKVVGRLLAYAEQAPITLVVDMAYFAYNSRPPRAFLSELRPLIGKVAVLFAWSASKTYTHYGLRVGALIACIADPKERETTASALSYSCRGTWSNCSRGGLSAVTRLLRERPLADACDVERERFKAMLRARVDVFNSLAPSRGLKYPRYEGGFFVTVFSDRAPAAADAMKGDGVFVVPQKGALRVALCSVAERDVPRLVESLAKHA